MPRVGSKSQAIPTEPVKTFEPPPTPQAPPKFKNHVTEALISEVIKPQNRDLLARILDDARKWNEFTTGQPELPIMALVEGSCFVAHNGITGQVLDKNIAEVKVEIMRRDGQTQRIGWSPHTPVTKIPKMPPAPPKIVKPRKKNEAPSVGADSLFD